MQDEEKGTYTDLNGVEKPIRYLMQPAVVTAKRISGATWEVKGPWPQPFYVKEEIFRKEFTEI